MSGGEFDYLSSRIDRVAEEIENIIYSNNEWDKPYGGEVIRELKNAVKYLKIAAIYERRVDWLISGDDNEDTFLRRLNKDLKELRDE